MYTDALDYFNLKDPLFTKCHEAAKLGNTRGLKRLIAKNKPLLDAQDALGNTPLHYAVDCDHYDATKFLVDSGASLTLKNNMGQLAAHSAQTEEIKNIFSANQDMLISEFVPADAEIEELSEPEDPLNNLFTAALDGDIENLLALLEKYPKLINKQDDIQGSLLHAAVFNNHHDAAEVLISVGIEVNISTAPGETPLQICTNGKIKKLLIDNGACTFSCMHKAVLDNDIEKIVELAITHHAFVDAIDLEGNTPLHYATSIGSITAIEALSDMGADFNKTNNYNQTAINHTVSDNIITLLKGLGANNHDQDLTKLHKKCYAGDIEAIKEILNNKDLLDALRGIDSKDGEGKTPLMHAVLGENSDAIDLLLSYNANPFMQSNVGFCAITYAELDGSQTELSIKLRKICDFSTEQKYKFEGQINHLIEKSLMQKENRNILFVLGETHDYYQIDQFENILLDCLAKYGINTLFYENDEEHTHQCVVPKAAKEKGFNVIAVDVHPNRANETISERNKVMSQKVNATNSSGILIVGSAHLKGLLSLADEEIDINKYHIIPLNLSPLSPENTTDGMHSIFSNDKNKIIQVTKHGLNLPSEPDTVMEQSAQSYLAWSWDIFCSATNGLFSSAMTDEKDLCAISEDVFNLNIKSTGTKRKRENEPNAEPTAKKKKLKKN